jgi:hypothetical protein
MNTFSLNTLVRWAATLGLVAGLAVYFLLDNEGATSSPLALLIIATLGFVVTLKEPLSGSILLGIAGASLLVHPFLYNSSLEYVIVGLLFFSSGVIRLIQWWNKE